MPPHLKTNMSPGSATRGRPRPTHQHPSRQAQQQRPQPHQQQQHQMLPPRAEKRHPPRPPQQRSLSVHSHQLPPHQKPPQQQSQRRSQHELRNAYKAQAKQTSNGSNKNLSLFDDHGSMSSVSAANSGATPSSVYMPSVQLSRDVSDLSGLSGGTRASSVPGQIFDPKSFQKPWRQAYAMSVPPPGTVKRREQDEKSKVENKNGQGGNGSNSNALGASIWVAQNDVVEIFDNLQSSFQNIILSGQEQQHNRIPIMILLMDPNRHVYELMQIWVDRANDSIRDLMQALQHKLQIQPADHQNQTMKSSLPSWKQAYDGIFQVRGQRFTQLINIIRLTKYDMQPHEILIAKPWSMNAKLTIAFAGTVIRHLRNIGVISPQGYVPVGLSGAKPAKSGGSSEDAALLLSKKAQERSYIPEGILSHHHAVQFVSFQPPFEKPGPIPPGLSSAMSPSQDDGLSSLGSLSGDRHDIKNVNVVASLGVPNRRNNPPSPKSVAELHTMNNTNVRSKGQPVSSSRVQHPQSEGIYNQERPRQSFDARYQSQSKPGVRGVFSKLNCFRGTANTKSPASASPMLNRGDDSISSMTPSGVRYSAPGNQYRETSLTSLSEAEELEWLAYSMQPIAEDQSLASGSIVSMSAPLLKAPQTGIASSRTQARKPVGGFPQPRAYSGQDVYEF